MRFEFLICRLRSSKIGCRVPLVLKTVTAVSTEFAVVIFSVSANNTRRRTPEQCSLHIHKFLRRFHRLKMQVTCDMTPTSGNTDLAKQQHIPADLNCRIYYIFPLIYKTKKLRQSALFRNSVLTGPPVHRFSLRFLILNSIISEFLSSTSSIIKDLIHFNIIIYFSKSTLIIHAHS